MKGMKIPDGVEELIICADRGDAGERAAKELAKRAHAEGRMARICHPPAEGEDWDECEPEDVRAAIAGAPVWEPGSEPEERAEGEPRKLVTITAASLLLTRAPPRKWLCDPWIPGDDVTLASGDGGVGKSTLALQLHWACATGRQWLGMTVTPCPSLYVSCEDPQREIHHRLEQFHDAETFTAPNLDQLHILDLTGEDALIGVLDKGRIVMTDLFEQIEALIREIGAGLVTFDAAADVFGGDEINRGQVRAFIAQLRGLSIRNTCASILIAHPSVDAMATGRGYSGSTAWNNSVRSRMYFSKPGKDDKEDGEELDPDLRKLELPKSNRGPAGQAKLLRWEAGRFVTENREWNDIEQQITDENLFMKLLDQYAAQNRNVCVSPGRGYAPNEFAKNPLGRSVSSKRFEHAMNTLLDVGKIINAEYRVDSKTRYRIVRA